MSSAKSQLMAVLENDTQRDKAVVDKITVEIGASLKEGPQYFRNFVESLRYPADPKYLVRTTPYPRKTEINAALEQCQAGVRLRIRRPLFSHRNGPLGHVWYLEFDSNELFVEFLLRWG